MAPLGKCMKSLTQLSTIKSKRAFKKFISEADDCLIDSISEILLNAIKPVNRLKIGKRHLTKLRKHAPAIRTIAKPRTPVGVRRHTIVSQSGGSFIPLLVSLALPVIQHMFSRGNQQ